MKKVKKMKALRWVALGAALPVIWACNSTPLQAPVPMQSRTFNNVFQETVNRDLDIVFMIDNSLSMAPLQTKLATNFPVFMQVLQGLPNGLPNVHIGVVSSNLGSGRNEVPNCPLDGDHGLFQSAPRGTCTNSGLMAGQTFISNVNMQANYTGNITDVFSCIAQLGDQGCGFEAPFASVLRALGADNFDNNGNPQPPPENANFLRPNAFLSIIFITNEDDCSVPGDSDLFNPGSRLVSDQYGPLASFRCNEYGHLCDGVPPSRTAAADYANCVPNDDGNLIRVSDAVDRIKMLKRTDPNKILVAAIAGFPTPYGVDLVAPMVRDDPAMWPSVKHACTQMTTGAAEYADPGVRLASFIQAFGRNGVYQSICADTFAPALQRIAEEIGKQLGPKCIDGEIVEKNGRPDCTVIDHTFTQEGNPIDTPVPACADNGNQAPCWQLTPGTAMACMGANQHILSVMRPAGPPQSDLNSSVSCNICIPGVKDAMNNPLPGCTQ